jgi:hypothetical protein
MANEKFSDAGWAETVVAGTDSVVGLKGGQNARWAWSAVLTYISNALVDAAPGTLDTLNELAAALGDDPNFATTVTTALSNRQLLSADLTAIAALTSAANKFPYSTGAGTWALGDLTAVARTLLAASTVAAQQAALGVNPSRLDPSNPTITIDEFEFASTETGEIGQLGWGFTNGTWNLVNPESGRPGTCRRASTAVSGTVASVFPGGGGAAPTHRFDQIDEQTWIIKPVTADTDYDLRFGWSSDFTSATASNGVYFEKLTTDTNWFGVSRTAGSQTRTDLGVAFAASWFKLRCRRIDASTVGFSINGGSEITLTSTIPPATNVLLFGFHIIPQSANARSVDVDWYGHRLVAQSR